MIIALLFACAGEPLPAAPTSADDTDTDTEPSQPVDDTDANDGDSGTDASDTDDTDLPTQGGGYGSLGNPKDIDEAILTLDGDTYVFYDQPEDVSSFGMINVLPPSPGACAPSTLIGVHGDLASWAPLIVYAFFDAGSWTADQEVAPFNAATAPPPVMVYDGSTHFLSGGTASYELLPSGTHRLTFSGARLCDNDAVLMTQTDPAVDCVDIPDATLDVTGTPQVFDYPGFPGTTMVGGIPRCVAE